MTTKSTTQKSQSSKPQSSKRTSQTKSHSKQTKNKNTVNIEAIKPGEKGRFIACVIGAIAMVALIVVGVSFLVNTIENYGKSSFGVTTGSGEKLETQYLGFNDYTFQLKIPKSFHALTENEIKSLYGDTNTPGYVYTNETNSVSVAVNITSSKLTNDQVKSYLSNTEDILGMNSEILSSNTTNLSNHTIASIRLTNDTEYNYMRFFSQYDKLVIVSFRCKIAERSNWEPVGKYILESLDFTR